MRRYILTFSLAISIVVSAQSQSESMTDSERLIRIETLMLERFDALDKKIDAVKADLQRQINDTKADLQRQINDVRTDLQRQIDDNKQDFDQKLDRVWSVMFWLGGMLLTAMFALMGFILWDRRSYLSAVKEQQRLMTARQELLERQQRLNNIVIDKLVDDDPHLKEFVEEAAATLDDE